LSQVGDLWAERVSRARVKDRFFDEESGMYMVTLEGFSPWHETTMPEILWKFMEKCVRLGGRLTGSLTREMGLGRYVTNSELTCTFPAPRRVSVGAFGNTLDVRVGKEFLTHGNSDEIRVMCRGCDTHGKFKLVLGKRLDAGMEGSKHARNVRIWVTRGFVEVKL